MPSALAPFMPLKSTTEQGGAHATWPVAKTSKPLASGSKPRWRRREHPRRGFSPLALISFLALAACFLVGASAAAQTWVEGGVRSAVRQALDEEGLQVVEIEVHGQHVGLRGTTPENAERARDVALEAAGPTWMGRQVAAVAVSLDSAEPGPDPAPSASSEAEPAGPEDGSQGSEFEAVEATLQASEPADGLTSTVATRIGAVDDASASAASRPSAEPLGAAQRCEERLAQILGERPIRFAVNSSRLQREAEEVLDLMAETLEGCRHANISVEGHTDASGAAPANRVLSESRSRAVLDGLVARGVHRSRMTSTGFGPTRPLVSEDTPAARALNRRIEVRIEAHAPPGGKD